MVVKKLFKHCNVMEYYGMPDYSKGLIYKLCCNDLNVKDVYVGSTTNFIRRKAQHKVNCNNKNSIKYMYPVYSFIRKNGNWENWTMVMVREYKTTSKSKLKRKERRYIEKLGATLNASIPSRTRKDYYNEHKEEISEKHKQWLTRNAEKVKEYKRNYNLKNQHKIAQYPHRQSVACECGCSVLLKGMKRHLTTKKHRDNMAQK